MTLQLAFSTDQPEIDALIEASLGLVETITEAKSALDRLAQQPRAPAAAVAGAATS